MGSVASGRRAAHHLPTCHSCSPQSPGAPTGWPGQLLQQTLELVLAISILRKHSMEGMMCLLGTARQTGGREPSKWGGKGPESLGRNSDEKAIFIHKGVYRLQSFIEFLVKRLT